MTGGGSDAYAARLAMEERREMLEEKRWDRYMRNMIIMIITVSPILTCSGSLYASLIRIERNVT
jgi:tRNA(Arg) A34 adenosine deaminase TadA